MIKSFMQAEFSPLLAENNSEFGCRRIGDACFDPQRGVYYPEKLEPAKEASDEEEKVNAQYLSDYETNLITCQQGYHFDMFCGEAQKQKQPSKKADVEIWIDISSSLRAIDYSASGTECFRKSFITRLQKKCGDKLDVSIFNTSLKELGGGLESLCLSHGLNDEKRLIEWVKSSSSKTLIIITDIAEYNHTLSDFFDSQGAKLVGVTPGDILKAQDLLDRVDSVAKSCH